MTAITKGVPGVGMSLIDIWSFTRAVIEFIRTSEQTKKKKHTHTLVYLLVRDQTCWR